MVAAEMWGMSVEAVMAGIADGSIPSRIDGHFLFVWAPSAGEPASAPPAFGAPVAARSNASAEIPVLTPQERQALAGNFAMNSESPIDPSSETSSLESSEPSAEPVTPGLDISQWRLGRLQAGRLRRGPQMAIAG
jgi:hypothetical protein